MLAFDTKTFVPVSRPALSGSFGTLEIGDGRFFVSGGYTGIGTDVRYGALEVQLPGSFTSWNPGFQPHTGFSVAPSIYLAGDVVVAFGTYVSDRWRMAVFDLTGTRAPTNLRARSAGGAAEFTWDAASVPPTGGYVLEAGLAAGQTAAAVPVGTGTTFVTPLAVAGPVFVRMRSQGGTEVSNEVVVGCLAPPLPPTALTTSLTGTNLSLAWTAPAGDVTAYTFLAGTTAGLEQRRHSGAARAHRHRLAARYRAARSSRASRPPMRAARAGRAGKCSSRSARRIRCQRRPRTWRRA